jgi:hypothetical protein
MSVYVSSIGNTGNKHTEYLCDGIYILSEYTYTVQRVGIRYDTMPNRSAIVYKKQSTLDNPPTDKSVTWFEAYYSAIASRQPHRSTRICSKRTAESATSQQPRMLSQPTPSYSLRLPQQLIHPSSRRPIWAVLPVVPTGYALASNGAGDVSFAS